MSQGEDFSDVRGGDMGWKRAVGKGGVAGYKDLATRTFIKASLMTWKH